MRASMLLRSAPKAKKENMFPSEVYPLIICMGLVTVGAGYRLFRNYMGEEVRSGHQGNDTARLPSSGHH